MENNQFICIDIGGTAIKYGILTSKGDVFFSDETPSHAKEGGPALACRVKELAHKLQQQYPDVKGIAISTAGVVDSQNARIVHASDAIPHYTGTSYKEVLADLQLPVEAENDVNCAGLSEYASGSAAGAGSALIMTIGTGIGGCFIEEGRLLHGHTFSACEVGYLPLDGQPFEKQAAASVLCTRVAQRKQEPEAKWDGRKIFAAAANGDVICQEEIARLAEILGRGIAALCLILNPEKVVLGGGIMAQGAMLRPLIEQAFQNASFPLVAKNTSIEFASHQNAAGMKGALVHFLHQHPELA